MLPKRRPRKSLMGTREGQGPLRSQGHRQWLRGFPCSVPGCKRLPIEAAHLSADLPADADRGGMSEKNGDDWTIPLCHYHHTKGPEAIHRGERTFAKRFGLNLERLAREFAAASPALRRMKMKERA